MYLNARTGPEMIVVVVVVVVAVVAVGVIDGDNLSVEGFGAVLASTAGSNSAISPLSAYTTVTLKHSSWSTSTSVIKSNTTSRWYLPTVAMGPVSSSNSGLSRQIP